MNTQKLIYNELGKVFFANKEIGEIKYFTKHKKCFISYVIYENDIYRKLNSWILNCKVLDIPDLNVICWKTNTNKVYGIKVDKINKFMEMYDTFIFKLGNEIIKYRIAIPVSLCNVKDISENKIITGIDIESFEQMIDNPRTLYKQWYGRKKGYTRSWSIGDYIEERAKI